MLEVLVRGLFNGSPGVGDVVDVSPDRVLTGVASITWFELAWLAARGRIVVTLPVRSSLEGLSAEVRTVGTTPAVESTAVSLPASFPGDPADRLIYATAIEHGWQLVTKDGRLRRHRSPRQIAIW